MMEEHLISISDELIRLNPGDLSEPADIIQLVESFGFEDAITDIPKAWRHVMTQANRLGLFRDDGSEYWIAKIQRDQHCIEVSHIGTFSTLRSQWQSMDLSDINRSRAYASLVNSIDAFQVELKYDRTGKYQNIYTEAEQLLGQLESETIENKDTFIEDMGRCARKFWQAEVDYSAFSEEVHGRLLPQSFRLDEEHDFVAVQDPKIVWISYRHEVERQWAEALTYEEFREGCSEIAAWALNASF